MFADALKIEINMEEIFKLALGLSKRKIPYTLKTYCGGLQLLFGTGDVICHNYSYGHEQGLLETMGFSWDEDDVTGYLTAKEILKMIDNGG